MFGYRSDRKRKYFIKVEIKTRPKLAAYASHAFKCGVSFASLLVVSVKWRKTLVK